MISNRRSVFGVRNEVEHVAGGASPEGKQVSLTGARIMHKVQEVCTKMDPFPEFPYLLVQARLHELRVRGTRNLHARNTFVDAPCA